LTNALLASNVSTVELGGRKTQEARFVESWLTSANKVFAALRP
jgi:hypothetical protein